MRKSEVVVIGIFALVCVVVLGILFFERGDGGTTPSAAATASPSASQSATATTAPTPAMPDASQLKQLNGQITNLISNYYLAKPGDTAETRKARLTPLMPAAILDVQSFDPAGSEISHETAATTAQRLQSKMSVKVRKIDTAHQAEQVYDSRGDIYYAVPVDIGLYRSNGSLVGLDRPSVTVIIIWEYVPAAHKWQPISFSEGGD